MIRVLIAMAAAGVIIWVGLWVLRGLARPLSEPPPAGEMRKVNLRYRCAICGTEVKMTLATDDLPDPPRHCLEDMQLISPID